MGIRIIEGDITEQNVDAIVNAANSTLLGGGGVDGAVHRRGGPAILRECRRLREDRFPDGLPTGQAVATTAGRLPARWVIHAVGPVYRAGEDRSQLLASCYRQALYVADGLGADSIAFPAVSAGAYGWPADSAAEIAYRTVAGTESPIDDIRFVLLDAEVLAAFRRVAAEARTDPPESS